MNQQLIVLNNMEDLFLTLFGLIIWITLTILPLYNLIKYWDKYNNVERCLWLVNLLCALLLLIGISAE